MLCLDSDKMPNACSKEACQIKLKHSLQLCSGNKSENNEPKRNDDDRGKDNY